MVNLLLNGELEGEYHLWRGTPGLQTAWGWTPWWIEQTGDDPAWKHRRPAFRRATGRADPSDDGERRSSQSYATPWGTHVAGLWQQVVVPPGARLRFCAWGRAWSSDADRSGPSQNPTHVHMTLGIDPTGGTDPMGRSVVWAEERNPIDSWVHLSVVAHAQSSVITVLMYSAPDWPKQHQVIYWDEASVEILGGGDSAPLSGGDGVSRIEAAPPTVQPGRETVIRVFSTTDYAYPVLLVRDPALELVPASEPLTGRQGDEYRWEYHFVSHSDGQHLLVFASDYGARVVCWTWMIAPGELPRFQPKGAAATGVAEEGPGSSAGLPATRGTPRIEYARTYVLLPPTADVAWAQAALRGGFDARRTVGFSADDAGIGDLGERRVIAVNPHHWPTELTADWFAQHYPGVRFYPLIVETPEELATALRFWRD